MAGTKHDQGKPPIGLIPRRALIATAHVLGHGATKYGAHNWCEGIEFQRLIDASLRHILAFNEGEDLDQESGLHHLAHAICELAFLIDLGETKPEMDDRRGRTN